MHHLGQTQLDRHIATVNNSERPSFFWIFVNFEQSIKEDKH